VGSGSLQKRIRILFSQACVYCTTNSLLVPVVDNRKTFNLVYLVKTSCNYHTHHADLVIETPSCHIAYRPSPQKSQSGKKAYTHVSTSLFLNSHELRLLAGRVCCCWWWLKSSGLSRSLLVCISPLAFMLD
jgi:hypothetical protein